MRTNWRGNLPVNPTTNKDRNWECRLWPIAVPKIRPLVVSWVAVIVAIGWGHASLAQDQNAVQRFAEKSSSGQVPFYTENQAGQSDQTGLTTDPFFPSGQSGGITSNDFQPLMDLIQSVIDPSSWQDAGGEGAIIDYPAGVFAAPADVVASAEISKQIEEMARLWSQPNQGSIQPEDRSFAQAVEDDSLFRTISLNRIEAAIVQAANKRKPLDPTLKNLAGIYRVDYVFIDSRNNDVLIAGPAGRWRENTSGQNVNVETGLPTLQLDDLMVCLHNAFHQGGKFGCTIVPKPSALEATQIFLQTATGSPASRKWRQALKKVVGKQDIIVHGVASDSTVARTIVEADCLMKQIGMGLKPSVDKVPNYFDRIKKDPDASNGQTLIRWWFTMAYDTLWKDAGNRVFRFDGDSVKVLSENELLGAKGQRIHTGKSNLATAGFASDFTEHFGELSNRYPVFADLKNVFDLALVANIVQQHDDNQRHRWETRFARGPVVANHGAPQTPTGQTGYQFVSLQHESEVDSIMNFENISYRRNGRKYRKSIVGVSGGVEFDFAQLLQSLKQVQQSRSAFPGAFFNRASDDRSPAGLSTSSVIQRWWWD